MTQEKVGNTNIATRVFSIVGVIMLAAGLAVFLTRLHHPGPYAMPHQGNLLAALLSLFIGLCLIIPWFYTNPVLKIGRWILVAASPVVIFYALYAILAEMEETVTLRANNEQGEVVDLRLWIVDVEGTPWVTMGRGKADAHNLKSAKVELLRNGVFDCVQTTQFEDPDIVNRAHRLRTEKYAMQRFAMLLGMFGETAGSGTVALRLDACIYNT